MNRVILDCINDQLNELGFTKAQLQGLKRMHQDFERNIMNYFSLESDKLSKAVKNHTIDIKQFGEQLRAFADSVSPSD